MSFSSDRKLNVLKVVQRKEEWDLNSVQVAANQAKNLLQKLSDGAMKLEGQIVGIENQMRAAAGGEMFFSMDEMERNRAFLIELHKEHERVKKEKDKAQSIVDEYSKRLIDLKARARMYETLAEKRQDMILIEQGRQEIRRMDELWLQSKGGKQ